MALPASGWVSGNEEGVVTRFPLPEPILAYYRDGDVSAGRPYPAPELRVLAAGGGRAVARASVHGGARAQEVELAMVEAFGVVLVDTIEGAPFFVPGCELPAMPEAGGCDVPAQPEWD